MYSTVVVRTELVHESEYTGESQTVMCTYMDGTARSVPVATVEVSCPVYSGKVNALCMTNPIYDVIIGNISEARKLEDADFALLPEAVEDGGVHA